VNSSFAIDVYLVSSNSKLGDPDIGLISGNFGVEIVSGTSTLTQLTGNTAFDQYSGPVTSTPWHLLQSDLDITNGTPFGSPSGSAWSLKLGTIQGMSASAAEVTLLRVIDPDNQSDDLVLGDGTELDSSVFPSSNFALNVTSSSAAVPEPSSLALFAIGASVAGYRFARRRYGKKPTA
jgi:hypothetical protein